MLDDRTHLEPIAAPLRDALDRLDRDRVVERIWAKDHTVWSSERREITDRLGWLDQVHAPPRHDAEISDLVAGARRDGLTDAVLLGMGGSSLGAEALRASFGERSLGDDGAALRLHVLDSTHPGWVRRVRASIDPRTTLFLVASKSGTTAEVAALRDYFFAEAEAALGRDEAARRFVAITDPGTPLADLAERQGWRHTFVNPPDIGGRFSVLSRFGLVAAALAGIDPDRLLAAGHRAARRCRPEVAVGDNPGAWLGAVLGVAATAGRDQLTLLTSPRVASFGLWVEQLIAESTGKDGKGILPVVGEPWADVGVYGADRLFVALATRDEDPTALDERVAALAAAGHPVVYVEIDDLHELGGEMFRWQMATAVAGHLLGIHPFDQPDVQATKSETHRILEDWAATGELPAADDAATDLAGALASERPRYLAIMAYADAAEDLEREVAALRRTVLERHGVTTTFGYGPRFLHSTGQLHKGGPDGGLFLQLLAVGDDLPIPGERFGFATLLRAQAAGDLAALAGRGRRTVRRDLGTGTVAGAVAGIRALRREVEAAVPGDDMKPERIQAPRAGRPG